VLDTLDVQTIEQRLRGRSARRYPLPGLRRAAVLLALFGDEPSRRTHVWLLRRPADGSPHGGQIALPGGKPEPSDADILATALREAHEEIGLPSARVRVLGRLDELVTVTRFRVTPFVGWIEGEFSPRASPSEVARVFAAPLGLFGLEPERRTVAVAGLRMKVACREFDGEVVWGATYAILRNFVGLVGGEVTRRGT